MSTTFSTKSYVLLVFSSLQLDPLSATFLNVMENTLYSQSFIGATVAAYLSVGFTNVDKKDGNKWSNQRYGKNINANQETKELLSKYNRLTLAPLWCCSEQSGIGCMTKCHTQALFQLLLSTYISNILECNELLISKRGLMIASPCHLCMYSQENKAMQKHVIIVLSIVPTKTFLDKLAFHRTKQTADHTFQDFSILPMLLALHSFPAVGIHSCVDIHAIYRVVPMHVLSLGISRMLRSAWETN